jgi:hypothetical protein
MVLANTSAPHSQSGPNLQLFQILTEAVADKQQAL